MHTQRQLADTVSTGNIPHVSATMAIKSFIAPSLVMAQGQLVNASILFLRQSHSGIVLGDRPGS